jgi:dynein intermediate chain
LIRYGKTDHSSWCSHKGYIFAWCLSARNFDQSKPSFIAESTGCLTYVCFHPTIPSMIVGGTFHGQIIIWSLVNQDPVVTSSSMSENSHQEPISQLIWAPVDNDYQLVSVGRDGKILIWDIGNLNQPVRM